MDEIKLHQANPSSELVSSLPMILLIKVDTRALTKFKIVFFYISIAFYFVINL